MKLRRGLLITLALLFVLGAGLFIFGLVSGKINLNAKGKYTPNGLAICSDTVFLPSGETINAVSMKSALEKYLSPLVGCSLSSAKLTFWASETRKATTEGNFVYVKVDPIGNEAQAKHINWKTWRNFIWEYKQNVVVPGDSYNLRAAEPVCSLWVNFDSCPTTTATPTL